MIILVLAKTEYLFLVAIFIYHITMAYRDNRLMGIKLSGFLGDMVVKIVLNKQNKHM